tara:strand:+ start:1402 stop:3729 length:2328 start_codon:yes stop_codon:yes gene_type:complete
MRKSQNIKLDTFKDKSTLVKLLAEEDLQVTYKTVPTAHFDVKAREVVLPIWKDKSEAVMDMMSLHEVGHALWTPMDLIKKGQKKEVKHSFLNVLEDVRIEKMIQEKYLGSVKVFKKAYTELLDKDFFNIKDKDLSKLNLIDRINMHYKNVPNVPFDDNELEWVEKANQTKTPDDVLNLAVELQEWMYNQQKDTESDEMFKMDIQMGDESEDESEDEKEENKSSNIESQDTDDTEESEDESSGSSNTKSTEDNTDDKEESEDKGFAKSNEGQELFDGIESVTDANYMMKQEMASDKDAVSHVTLNIPKINLDKAIIDYKDINKELTTFYKEKCKGSKSNTQYMQWIVEDIKRFEKEQKPVISYMVKEFEMRKAADLYKRSTVSKTGSLNMDKLHSYSYNEDIFLKMNVEPGATNHGLVMFVDWSGSMSDNFHNTLKQTLNLVWFCKRVNIPFEVYGFTNQYSHGETSTRNVKAQTPKQNDLVVDECTLLNLLSSRANKNEFQESLVNFWAISNYWCDRMNYGGINVGEDKYIYPIYIPSNYNLGSTPLNHSIVYAMDLLPKFKKDYGLQKVHTVFLTDGASNSISSSYQWGKMDRFEELSDQSYDGEFLPGYFDRGTNDITIIDPVNNKKYEMKLNGERYQRGFSYDSQTNVLVEFLKARVPGMNVVNFFIAGRNRKGTVSRNEIEYIFRLGWNEYEEIKKIQKFIRKHNYAVCTTSAWDEMYVLPGGQKLDVSNDDMSEVKPGAKKTELKKAFGKMSSGKKNSRPVLNKFVGMIA